MAMEGGEKELLDSDHTRGWEAEGGGTRVVVLLSSRRLAGRRCQKLAGRIRFCLERSSASRSGGSPVRVLGVSGEGAKVGW